jgi:hypothetical protein
MKKESPAPVVIRRQTMLCVRSLWLHAVLCTAAVADVVRPVPLEQVRLLDGPFKEIQELHRTGMVGKLEPDKLLFPFRKNAGLPQPDGVTGGYGGWDDAFIQGHYAGHFLTAAARMFAATGDVSFRDKANSMVSVMAECQQRLGGGYLSAFPQARLDKLEANPHAGLVEYYTLHKILAGLVDVARYCHNPQALDVAERMSDHIAARMAKLSPERIELLLRTDYTGNPVNEFGGMAEALADLYQLSESAKRPDPERHLKLAALFCRDWFIDPLVRGENHLNGLHGNTHAAQASGLARYSLASGDDRSGNAAEAFWNQITRRHSFVNGGNGFNEKLRAPGTEVSGGGDSSLSPMTSEYCNTNNMLKLTHALFQRHPGVAYADYDEHALYNHILAAIAPDHGRVIYHMPMRPGDYRVHIDSPFCCQGTGIENTARFGEGIYFQQENELWVNLYIASTLDWKEAGIQLHMETRYPQDGKIRITVEAAAPKKATLHLRIPSWLQASAEASINAERITAPATPGSYLTLTRDWKSGDVIELHLPLSLRIRPSMDDPTIVSFFHGPVVLAGKLGRDLMPASDIGGHTDNEKSPPFPVPFLVADSPADTLRLLRPDPSSPLEYNATMRDPKSGGPVEVKLAPFYQVHHQRYALYWKTVKPGDVAAHLKKHEGIGDGTMSFIGDAEAEKSRGFQGGKTSTGGFNGRQWRDARDGGWFSYRLPVFPGNKPELICTYWGGENVRRVFDILVEDKKIATQTLDQNKPNEFFDVSYPIPQELTRGKQFVTIRFQAPPDGQAGGVFDVRISNSGP